MPDFLFSITFCVTVERIYSVDCNGKERMDIAHAWSVEVKKERNRHRNVDIRAVRCMPLFTLKNTLFHNFNVFIITELTGTHSCLISVRKVCQPRKDEFI